MKKIVALFIALILSTFSISGVTATSDEKNICDNFEYILNSDGTAEIYEYLGDNSKSITIPNELDGHKVTGIGYAAFYCHPKITSVFIPDTVMSIGESAFEFCTGIKNINIPDSVTDIGKSAFQFCSGLEKVTLGDGLTKIDVNTFKYCKNLKIVTIGNNINCICERAFQSCSSLTSITIPVNVKKIEDYAMGYDSRNARKVDGFTIIGSRDSEAERYANSNGFTFNAVGSSETEPSAPSSSETQPVSSETQPVSSEISPTEPSSDTTDKTDNKPIIKAKKSNPMKVTVKTKTVSLKKIKKAKQTVAPITVKKAQGKVSYKKLSGSKKLTLKSNGKIVVKKAAKKGTYTAKIKVTAKGNSDYESATKTVTVKVKVK